MMKPYSEWQDAEPGVRRRIMEAGAAIMNMIVEFEPGAEGYIHTHIHEQLTYVLSGKFEFTIDEQVVQVEAGDSIYIPSLAKHGVKALTQGTLLDTFTPLRQDLLDAAIKLR